jgi:hypothetical protein
MEIQKGWVLYMHSSMPFGTEFETYVSAMFMVFSPCCANRLHGAGKSKIVNTAFGTFLCSMVSKNLAEMDSALLKLCRIHQELNDTTCE